MFAYIERRLEAYREVRAVRRVERAARSALEENLRYCRIRFCPGCQVPIEKNEGCDHMHCALCGYHFSWRSAIPCNLDVLDNTGDGRWRFCPHCRYQNQKLHALAEAKCAQCRRDFKWDEALFVPLTQIRTPTLPPSANPGDQPQPPAPPAAARPPATTTEAAQPARRPSRDNPQRARGESVELTAIPEGEEPSPLPVQPPSSPNHRRGSSQQSNPVQAERVEPFEIRRPEQQLPEAPPTMAPATINPARTVPRRERERPRFCLRNIFGQPINPMVRISTTRRSSDDCGARRGSHPPQMSSALRHWLNDARRLKLLEEIENELSGTPHPENHSHEETQILHESLRCEICAARVKSFALPCGHLFCEHCLVMYLREHPICPVDRSVVQAAPIKIYF